MEETIKELLENIRIDSAEEFKMITVLNKVDSRYIRDLKVNVSNVLKSKNLSEKETALLSISVSANAKNTKLIEGFTILAAEKEATEEEIAEAIACASLLASNNVFYRFRHFLNKDSYNKMPGKIKMNIMMRPVGGKEFFELMSLAVSAVNGCEMCVNAHENSVLALGSSEERIWDSIRLASVITSLDKIIN